MTSPELLRDIENARISFCRGLNLLNVHDEENYCQEKLLASYSTIYFYLQSKDNCRSGDLSNHVLMKMWKETMVSENPTKCCCLAKCLVDPLTGRESVIDLTHRFALKKLLEFCNLFYYTKPVNGKKSFNCKSCIDRALCLYIYFCVCSTPNLIKDAREEGSGNASSSLFYDDFSYIFRTYIESQCGVCNKLRF